MSDTATQGIRFDRLATLSGFLRTLAPERFDYCSPFCGTKACAIGHCPEAFPEDWEAVMDGSWARPRLRWVVDDDEGLFGHAATFFGIAMDDADDLFAPNIQVGPAATPTEVADHIDRFIAAKRGA